MEHQARHYFAPWAMAGAIVFAPWPLQLLHRTREPVNMPISLAVGHVTTPEFKVIKDRYIILVVAKKRLPFDELVCMIGMFPSNEGKCHDKPLVQADWTVSSNGRIVAQGASHEAQGFGFTNKDVSRFLGEFEGEKGKKYVLDVEFTKDATALAVTDPHLSVQISNESY
jgi:hypothetical protein